MFFANQQSNSTYYQVKLWEIQSYGLPKDCEIIDQYLSLDLTLSNLSTDSCIKDQKFRGAVPAQNTVFPSNSRKIQKQKSVFHNFQKHLITVLKKFVHFSRKKLSSDAFGQIAYCLWCSFLNCSFSNKKALSLVFGSADPNIIQKMKTSKQFAAFDSVFSSYSIDEIQQAQRLLRQKVADQAVTLPKNLLRSNSNICKFDDFYLYLRGFIIEIRTGPLARRFAKSSKIRILNKLGQNYE